MIGTVNKRRGSKSSKCPPSRSQVSTNHNLPAKINGYRTATRKETQKIKELEDQIRDMRMSTSNH
jgi:hypothetical protein